jgi:hypothetical protein
MKKIKEQIEYGDRPERMDPNLERKLRSGQDIYASNPAMRKGAEDVQRLVSSRFNKVADSLKRVTGIEDLSQNHVKQMLMGEMMMATQQVMSIESRHKEQLKELAEKISFLETGVPKGTYEVVMYLNESPIDTSDFRFEPEDDEEEEDEKKPPMKMPSFEIEDLTPEEEFELEKHKRNIVLALIQGSAKKAHYAYQKFPRELDRINPQLYPLYNKIMAINDFFYFTMEQMIDMMSQTGSGIAGKVDTETIQDSGDDEEEGGEGGEGGESRDVITAFGMIFPILVHEVVKGIDRFLSQHSLPKNPKLAQRVMGQTDLLRNEPSQLRIGPEIVEILRMSLPDEFFESGTEEYLPWFKIELYKIDAKEFVHMFGDILDTNEKKKEKGIKKLYEIFQRAKQAKAENESDDKDDDDIDYGDDDDDDGGDDDGGDGLDNLLGNLGISRSKK